MRLEASFVEQDIIPTIEKIPKVHNDHSDSWNERVSAGQEQKGWKDENGARIRDPVGSEPLRNAAAVVVQDLPKHAIHARVERLVELQKRGNHSLEVDFDDGIDQVTGRAEKIFLLFAR